MRPVFAIGVAWRAGDLCADGVWVELSERFR